MVPAEFIVMVENEVIGVGELDACVREVARIFDIPADDIQLVEDENDMTVYYVHGSDYVIRLVRRLI